MTIQNSPANVANYPKMNKHIRLIVIAVGLAIGLVPMQVNMAQAQKVTISRNFQPNPLTLTGTSGGAVKSNCGNFAATPNHIIEIKEPLRLNFSVTGSGEPTLLIEGPSGRFCSLSDNYSGGKSEISGYWIPGDYTIRIGQSSPSQANYTLSISQPKK